MDFSATTNIHDLLVTCAGLGYPLVNAQIGTVVRIRMRISKRRLESFSAATFEFTLDGLKDESAAICFFLIDVTQNTSGECHRYAVLHHILPAGILPFIGRDS